MYTLSNALKCFLLLMLFIANVNAQISPGGVSDSLGLWMKATSLDTVTTGSSGVMAWPDFSANNLDAVFHSAPTGDSMYRIDEDINFNKSIRINDEWFESPLSINEPNVNVFMVYKLIDPNVHRPLWGNGSNNAVGKQAYVDSVSDGTTYSGYSGANTTGQAYLNHINTIDNGVSSIHINGDQVSSHNTMITVNNNTYTGVYIGKEQDSIIANRLNTTLSIAEFIAYTGSITQGERERINSYLAIKYGISLDHDYTINGGSTLVWDNTGNNGYNNNIIGIARDNNSTLDITKSKSEESGALITLSATNGVTAIPNSEALLIGHNDLPTDTSTNFKANNFFVKGKRLKRIWKCQKAGGSRIRVDLSFDNTIMLPSNDGFQSGNLVLLVADDALFNNNLQAHPLTINTTSSDYEVSGVEIMNGQFFTIAHLDVALWIKADASANAIGSPITLSSYYDNVFGINTMSSPSVANNPTHVLGTNSSSINFNPYIKFNDGSLDQYIEKSDLKAFGNSGVSTFLVLRKDNVTSGNSTNEAILSYASSVEDNELVVVNPSDLTVYINEPTFSNISGHPSSKNMMDSIPHIFTNLTGDQNNNEIRLDGDGTSLLYKNMDTVPSKGTLIFGQEQDALGGNFSPNQAYQGDLAEAIIFNQRITSNDRNAIETYLAIKYGVTLQGNYVSTNGTILWDSTVNMTYHNNIAGIAREDEFDLDQQKSISQNGSTVDVTIKANQSTSIPNNSYLIWGCNSGVFDSIIPTNALASYQISDKKWKVQNKDNQVGLVDVTLRIPPSQSAAPVSELKLIVENRDTFSLAATFYSTNLSASGWITFTNVNLQDNDFFSLAIEDRPTVDNYRNNSNQSSPNSFEACVGDAVTFTYDSLSHQPNLVQLTNDQGGVLNIPVAPMANFPPVLPYHSGSISITIPSNTSTGSVKLVDTLVGGILYNYNNNLIIHKPLVDLYVPQAPICATDTVPLIGIPLGGTFSTTYSSLIQNDSLIGMNANWSANTNDSIKNVVIGYSYAPSYLNGEVCSTPILSEKSVVIRDNRLNVLDYQYLITDSINLGINDRVLLDTSILIIQKLSPEFRGSFNYPVNFSGNYVNEYNGIDSFLTDDAGFGRHTITMSYDNGGCIGALTNDIIVLPPFKLSGLVDTLCNQASFITLGRDTDSTYAYRRIDTIPPTQLANGNKIKEIVEFNIIKSVSTLDTNHRAALITINTTPNNEEYRFNPQSPVLSGVGSVDIALEYIPVRIIRETLDSNNVPIAGTLDTLDDRYTAQYPIILLDTPTISLNLDSIYCKNAPIDSLNPSPIFENQYARLDYYFSYTASGQFFQFAPLTYSPEAFFNPDSIYTQLRPLGAQNQDVYVELEYTYDRYGCTTSYIKSTKIIKPVAFSLFFDPPLVLSGYCKSSVPIELAPINTISNPQGTGAFLVDGVINNSLVDTSNHFLPDSAQSQDYDISYEFVDSDGCISTSSVTRISIREPALIRLEIDSNSTNPKICGNRDVAILETILTSGGNATNIAYNTANITYSSSNLIISNDTLRPADTYDYNGVNGSITEFVTVNYSDSFSCSSTDILPVEIYKPLPRMNGFVNPIDSTYTYCNNRSPFAIVEAPSHSFGIDTIYGEGVTYANGVYYYTPDSVVVDSFVIDIVQYEYEDALGCSATTERRVRINGIPDVSLTGLDSAYCANDSSVQLSGMPNNFTSTLPVYSGVGVNAQGLFSPILAGTGIKDITYSFVDTNGCEGSITERTTIYGLPSPNFTFPKTQFCSSDTMVVLDTSSAMGIYSFWGGIINANHILNPQDSIGQQIVFYSLTDNYGCIDSNSTTILINPIPVITISGLDPAYCFNSAEDNILLSPTPSTGGSITGSSAGFNINSTGTGVIFDPGYDTDGVKVFNYIYEDSLTNCENSVQFNTTIYEVVSPTYGGIDSVYCATDSFYSIIGIPTGGVFTGTGISNAGSQYYFNPFFAGSGSPMLNYSLDTSILHNASYLLSCQVSIDIPVVVNPLPNLIFNGPGDNYRFCSNEADVLLTGAGSAPTSDVFTSDSLGAISVGTYSVIDTLLGTFAIYTSYSFSPSNAGAGIHDVTYTGTDSITGCQTSITRTYDVTDYGNGASFLLDSAYCASSDSILLTGSPAGGGFLRNQDSIPSFYLTLNASINLLDTIIYKVIYEACSAADTQLVRIDSLIDLSFYGSKSSKIYCFGEDDSPLIPNVLGGTFSGNAVITGDSLFSMQYATAGDNIINYSLIDSATYCESTATDTFSVYGMPDIDFQVIGGCQLDSIFFYPDNDILGLDNTFGTEVIDSITEIVWQLEQGVFINGSNNLDNEIDSINHIFNAPGVYHTKLYVTNRTYCADSATVRIVISPTVTVTDIHPHLDTFENSNGNWYAEAKDTSHNLLWEWGADTISLGINEPNNKVWVTGLNDQYAASEAAWVYSPCFDISSLERPMIRFDHWSHTRPGADGAVLEFQDIDGTWSPLGEFDRGVNWFNSIFIAGSPGNQVQSPNGWSSDAKGWVNSRYKLDEFKNTQPSKLRLRMAFGSSSINLGAFHNGFAFDNVWIGNRTRNVLVETTSNKYEPNMDYVNNKVYQLIYHSDVNKDVILLQYHSGEPSINDEFYQFNPPVSSTMDYSYGISNAGIAMIDGISDTKSEWLNHLSFEQNMLETPKFDVVIDTFQHTNQPGEFTMVVTVTALVDIPAFERYRINMVITEDSLSYLTGEKVHAVVRKDYPSNSINTFNKSWAIGEQVTLRHTYSSSNLNYVPNHFQAVAFIQSQTPGSREVFQAATTRDVSGYWVGVDQVASEKELNEIKDMTLYPNPAKDYINIDFPELLEKDYNWKLITIGGITVKEDVIHAGEQSLTINNYDLPSGVYIFMIYNDNVYSQRKVIINQD